MKVRRVLGPVFVIAAFVFLGIFVARDLDQLHAYEWQVRPWLLIVSIALHVAGLIVGVAAWKLLLRNLGYPVGLRGLARVWFLSGLGRYIPGKIWQFVGAAHLGTGSGLPALVTVTSLAAHTFFFVVAAALVAVYLVPLESLGLASSAALGFRVTAPLLLLLLHPWVIRRVLHLLRRLSGRDLGEWSGTWRAAISVAAVATVAWVITGSALFLFIRSLVPIEAAAAPAVVGINGLAFVAGYLVFIAPAGLGAKEGALAALLSIYLPISVAALIAVAARLWTVAAEILPALALLRAPGPVAPPNSVASRPPPH
ncbi:MAG TPA: lysylphosphatidylglycerol synthase domain-containing protein [Longimicrobiaceae bacterium]|nr:lysylphosphatidylglycerol synthase domain-containing protein [Longimicrobiaceae bacterium]